MRARPRSAASVLAVVALSLIATEVTLRLANLRVLRQDSIPFVALDGAAAYGTQYGAHFTPEGNRFVSGVLEKFLTEQTGKD